MIVTPFRSFFISPLSSEIRSGRQKSILIFFLEIFAQFFSFRLFILFYLIYLFILFSIFIFYLFLFFFYSSYRGYTWFCIPIFFPLMGSMLAAFFYKVFVSFHRPEVISITPEGTGRQPDTLESGEAVVTDVTRIPCWSRTKIPLDTALEIDIKRCKSISFK